MEFNNSVLMSPFGISNSVIIIIGKVHGSLARAGKVKGQTPPVSFLVNFCCVCIVFSCTTYTYVY